MMLAPKLPDSLREELYASARAALDDADPLTAARFFALQSLAAPLDERAWAGLALALGPASGNAARELGLVLLPDSELLAQLGDIPDPAERP